MSITHTLHDAIAVAERAGIGVCIDLFSCWTESGLRENLRRAMPDCALVQVSDYTFGDRSLPCRTVPGDGGMPLERLIGWVVEAGYRGSWEFELIGPRIEKEGVAKATARSAAWLTQALQRLGA
jgi:sugar phosphate isomerase/epimerase